MVDLPSVPNSTPELRAPVSRVSPGQIAQPYLELASNLARQGDAISQNLSKAGDVLSRDVAVPAATQAGAAAQVTRDADGNLQVERPLLVGDAAVSYEHALKVATVTRVEDEARRADIERRAEFRSDPQAYLIASDKYRDTLVADYTKLAGPEVGNAIHHVVTTATTQTYHGLWNDKEKLDLQRADGDISVGIEGAKNDATVLARKGVPLDAPEMQQQLAKYQVLLNTRAANPRLAYTPAQAQSDFDQFNATLGANAFLHVNDQVYQQKGYAAAAEHAKGILTNPDIKLSETQREAYYHRALGEVRANEAIRRQDIGEARAAFNELTMASATGMRIDPDQVEKVANAFRSADDPGGAARVYASFARKPLNDDFALQPAAARAQQISTAKGMQAAQEATTFFVGKGYSPVAAAGIVGNLAHESGMDPGAVGDGGTSAGLAQFHNERLAALREFAKDRGKPPTDFQTQLEFIHHELQTTEKGTLAKLQAAKTPEDAALAGLDYERPKGWTPENPAGGLGFESRKTMARAIFDGKSDAPGGPGASAWLVANRQRTSDKATWDDWSTIMKDYNSEKKIIPSSAAVNGVIAAARATNNAALLEQIGADMARIDQVKYFGSAPGPERHATIATMQADANAGRLAPGSSAVLKDLERTDAAITKGLQENPIATTVANLGDRFNVKDAPPLDFSSDEKLAAGLKLRGQIAQIGANNWKEPALSALDAADVQQVKGILASPDVAVQARVFRALGSLPENIRGATLAKLADNGPETATRVFAGALIPAAPDVAKDILTGMQAQTADDRLLPNKGVNKQGYNAAKDAAFPIAAFNVASRTSPTGAYPIMSQAVDALYAARSAQAGDTTGTLDKSRLQKAVEDVTGGVLQHNSGPIIAPQRGLKQSEFDSILQSFTDADMKGVTTGGGTPITADYLRNSAKLHSVADGRYLVQVNQDDKNPLYAKGPDGGAFVLDMRDRTIVSPARQASTALATGLAYSESMVP